MEIENIEGHADRTVIYPRHPGSFQSIQFKLSQSFLESPMHRRHQNSLTYTASMETVQDHLKFYDQCQPYSPGRISLYHKDIFIQGIKLQCPEIQKPAISLRLITDESEEIQNLLGQVHPPSQNLCQQLMEMQKNDEQVVIVNADPTKNPQIFKKQSTLKINNIQYEGKINPSEKSIPTNNSIHSNITKNTNKMIQSKICKRKFMKKGTQTKNQGDRQPSAGTRKRSQTIVDKSSIKIINLLDSGSDFIDEQNLDNNKSNCQKRGRVFSVIDSIEYQSPYIQKISSISPRKNMSKSGHKKIKDSLKKDILRRESSIMSKYKKLDTKISPQLSKRKEEKKIKQTFEIIATKVSLTDRKTCRNSLHAMRNQQIKGHQDGQGQKNPNSLKIFNISQLSSDKKEGECPELPNIEINNKLMNKNRQNIYHRKVLYMR